MSKIGGAVLVAALLIALASAAGTGYLLVKEPVVGPQGAQGPIGQTGPQGPQGKQGTPGLKGDDGLDGPRGYSGASGSSGATGATGPMGPPGVNGTNGINGTDGEDGEQGPPGEQGEQGIPGEDGEDGMDAPINIPPTINCNMNGSWNHVGYHNEWYTWNLSVNVSDSDNDTVLTTVYYKTDVEDNWNQLWMTTDTLFNCSKVKSYSSAYSRTLWWLVVSWDGSDLSSWEGNYTIVIL